MIHILLVDDDPHIRTIIREYAQAEDWQFTEAGNGEEALRLFSEQVFSLVILDVMMPKLDGWATLKLLRKDNTVPVILLTARDEEYDRLLGFELGVDDYVSKPFSPRELIARMNALLKRSGVLTHDQQVLVFDNLTLDLAAHSVTIDGESIALTPKEYDLLAFFAARPGKAFTRDQLLNNIWGYDYFGDSRTVDTHIRSLRDKMGDCRTMIATVWGTGYRFDAGGGK
ncbi:MAG: response regulator transcription factor [Clostridiaceae bacterium]|nr:response regulator transcription factor [Clostridiaceae bacterium]